MKKINNKTKCFWIIVIFLLHFNNAQESPEKYQKMIRGKYICFDDVDISLAEFTFEENQFTFIEDNVLKKEKQPYYFKMSDTKISKRRQVSLTLRKNGNIYIYDNDENLSQVLYKIPEKCKMTIEDLEQSLSTVFKLQQYEPKDSQLLNRNQFHPDIFKYNQTFLKQHIKEIFQHADIKKLMEEKILHQDPEYSSPIIHPQKIKYNSADILHCGICFMIFGVICLLIFHFFLSPSNCDATSTQKSTKIITTDSSYSNRIYVSDDKIQIIHVEPKYLSASKSSSSQISTKPYGKNLKNISISSDIEYDGV